MNEWICDDRFDIEKRIAEINAMSDEERKRYIEDYEKSEGNHKAS